MIYSSSEASGVNHIIFNEGEARVENMVLPCNSELCNNISYQVEMVRSQSTNQFIGSITPTTVLSCGVLVTQFLRKQRQVTSYVFEVAWELAVLSFSHAQIEIILSYPCANNTKTMQIILICTVLVLFAHGQDDIISIIILICTANRARNTFYQTGITPSRSS